MGEWGPLRLVAFDLDGVLYRGAVPLPGAAEAVCAVRERGLAVSFVTNNSTLHRSQVAAKLAAMGIPAEREEVLSSAAATATWLSGHLEGAARLLVIGEEGLEAELTEAGFSVRHAGAAAPAEIAAAAGVVVGLDRAFDYPALAAAQEVLLRGGVFVATNGDTTYPTEEGIRPGAGAMVAAVAAAGGADPVVIGKPHLGLAEALRLATGVPAGEILFVGDRLETDITFALRAGMLPVLVLTGVTSREDLAESDVEVHAVLEGLESFPRLLEELTPGR